MSQEKHAQPWKKLSQRWQKYYTFPGRPSKSAIDNYRKFAKKVLTGVKNPKILILGVTPELRDLVAEFKSAQVAAIDINLEMILAMTEICKKCQSDEILVRGNWTSTPFTDNYFDVVMGDLVLANVPHKLQDQFLKEVARVLKPNGYFIQRIEVVCKNHKKETVDELFEKYAKIPMTKSQAMEMFCHFRKMIFDAKNKTIDIAKLKKLWSEWWKNNQYQHPSKQISFLLNQNWQMWEPLDKVWSVDYEDKVARQVEKYFKIEGRVVLSDCYYHEVDEIFPLWLCKVRK